MSDHAKKTIASQEQIATAIKFGFENLSRVTTLGFRDVTNSIRDLNDSVDNLTGAVREATAEIRSVRTAIEELHSDLDYRLGTLM
jgi:methyl-accepting chemotaxis protein